MSKKRNPAEGSEQPLPQQLAEDAVPSSDKMTHTWMEEIYRDFEERGGMDDLPGKGKPLKLEDGDVLSSILKNANYLPPWVELRMEIRGRLLRICNRIEAGEKDDAELNRELEEINLNIRKYNQMVPSPLLQRSKVYLETVKTQLDKWD